MCRPGATISGLVEPSAVTPNEEKLARRSSATSTVSLVSDAPTVITNGSLPGAYTHRVGAEVARAGHDDDACLPEPLDGLVECARRVRARHRLGQGKVDHADVCADSVLEHPGQSADDVARVDGAARAGDVDGVDGYSGRDADVAAVGGFACEHVGDECAVTDGVVEARTALLTRQRDTRDAAAEVSAARQHPAVEHRDSDALARQPERPGSGCAAHQRIGRLRARGPSSRRRHGLASGGESTFT